MFIIKMKHCQRFNYLGAKYTRALGWKVECRALQLDSTNTILQTKDFKFLNASCCNFPHPAVNVCFSHASICTSVQKQYIHFKKNSVTFMQPALWHFLFTTLTIPASRCSLQNLAALNPWKLKVG
jgi:hypothetical protein